MVGVRLKVRVRVRGVGAISSFAACLSSAAFFLASWFFLPAALRSSKESFFLPPFSFLPFSFASLPGEPSPSSSLALSSPPSAAASPPPSPPPSPPASPPSPPSSAAAFLAPGGGRPRFFARLASMMAFCFAFLISSFSALAIRFFSLRGLGARLEREDGLRALLQLLALRRRDLGARLAQPLRARAQLRHRLPVPHPRRRELLLRHRLALLPRGVGPLARLARRLHLPLGGRALLRRAHRRGYAVEPVLLG